MAKKNQTRPFAYQIAELDADVKELKVDIHSLQIQIDTLAKSTTKIPQMWETSFFEFRSELFNKIDKDYLKPIMDLRDENAAHQFRLEEHERKISKLEKIEFTSA